MCGIVGYAGPKQAQEILVEGLKRLEYRGYDSAGIAVNSPQDNINGGYALHVVKSEGRISLLEEELANEEFSPNGNIGIGHTRWATHGSPSEVNAHPHVSKSYNIAIVHNGIIENYEQLADDYGIECISETDTEVLAQMIGREYCVTAKDSFEKSVVKCLHKVRGAYAIAVISPKEPNKIVVAKNGSPLIIGLGIDNFVVASDMTAIVQHTNQVIHLEDGQWAVLQIEDGRPSISIKTLDNKHVKVKSTDISDMDISSEDVELGGYPHYMFKEIHEQPARFKDLLRGRLEDDDIKLGGISDYEREILYSKSFTLIGQGTALNACRIGAYMLEDLARVHARAEFASELRYRNPVYGKNSTIIAVSQSGETADTLISLQEAKKRGCLALGVVNAPGSTISRETHAGVYLRAGQEIGVASTKAFSNQVGSLALLTLWMGRRLNMSCEAVERYISSLKDIPELMEMCIDLQYDVEMIASELSDRPSWLFLGRGYLYPAAVEGALKLKEISYLHAEGMPASEMKHGPLSLIHEGMPIVFLAPKNRQYGKIISNIKEAKSRGAHIITVGYEKDNVLEKLSDSNLYMPETTEALQPLLATIPMQFLAYYVAKHRGCDIDKPRNLAKSVTVE